jgi:hypothetical protein
MFEESNFDDNHFSGWRNWRNRLWRVLVIRPALAWQEWRCSRAKAYLLTHDLEYRSKYIGHEIVVRRNRLYGEGMSPDDPAVPDRWTIVNEIRPMAWPHGIEERG